MYDGDPNPALREEQRVNETPNTTPRCKAQLAELEPYEPVSSLDDIRAYPYEDEPLKLDWNESTIAPSPRVVERIQQFMANTHHLNWYPDLFSHRLLPDLAAYTGRSEDEILVTSGSDDALDLICKTFLDPGDEVVLPRPTYTHFLVFAQAQGGRVVSVVGPDPFEKNIGGLVAALTPRTKIVYLVSPNNPTGQLYTADEVTLLARRAPQALIIVDEAYHEFCGVTAAGLVGKLPNVVVTRTFSKAYGLAGLRIGYAMSTPDVLRHFKKIHNPKGVNVIAQIAAKTALADQEHLQRFVADVTESKGILCHELGALGFPCRATPANYVNVRVPDPAGLCRALAERNVYVRNRDGLPGMKGVVRITVGTPAQTRVLLDRLRDALRTAPSSEVRRAASA